MDSHVSRGLLVENIHRLGVGDVASERTAIDFILGRSLRSFRLLWHFPKFGEISIESEIGSVISLLVPFLVALLTFRVSKERNGSLMTLSLLAGIEYDRREIATVSMSRIPFLQYMEA